MKRLLLMRHAKTENWYQGTDDESRALVARGWSDARLISEALCARGWQPDKAIVSTARRTRETWRAMSETMPETANEVLEEMYLISPEALLQLIEAQWEGAETLLVIGHNPGLHELAITLAHSHLRSDAMAMRALEGKMPTCGTALFERDDRGTPLDQSLMLTDFIVAKDLRET